ncbi:MAG: hypothetical protein BGO05_02845 [Rhizobiales bacterium 63-7]|nr:transposase [Hyphomicrobiales bacterium]OJU69090.1 MAG: hypothetical protein BGO05_02845 [Rhizobiales bacterium 63-7]
MVGDRGFDDNRFRGQLRQAKTKAVIPLKADRKEHISCDFAMYGWRHLIENFFSDLKQFRGIATRYDKTDCSFTAAIFLRAIQIALK